MADKLKGVWSFDKIIGEYNTSDDTTLSWDIDFSSNGKRFARLLVRCSDFTNNNYSTPKASIVRYFYPDGVTNENGNNYESCYVWDSGQLDATYKTIEIYSNYNEVENADTLVQALTARATFTPDGADFQVPMTSSKGVRLKTVNTFSNRDISVIPELEELNVTSNGEYTPSKVGFSKVSVNVQSGGGGDDEFSLDKYHEGGYAEITLPNATRIRDYGFYQYPALETISIPKVTYIGANAFQYCSKLKNIALPEGLTHIHDYAFANCPRLAQITLPDSLTFLGGNVFKSGTDLTSLTIPSLVPTIYAYLCHTNPALTTVTFKGTPTAINKNAFYNCTALATINVPWAEGAVANAPWGATNATINYNYTGA